MVSPIVPSGVVAPAGGFQNNGWYGGYNYFNGQFAPTKGAFAAGNPAGTGVVSSAVNQQSDASQGLNTGTIDKFVGNPGSSGGASATGGGATPSNPAGINLNALYDTYYNTPENQTLQKNITDTQTQLNAKDKANADALALVNDNPFYSEGTRTGKIAKQNEAYNNDKQVLVNQLATYNDTLTKNKADAQVRLNLQSQQYDINEKAHQDNLSNFNTLLSAGALNTASSSDIANLAVTLGIPTSVIDSAIKVSQSKEAGANTQVIQSTDDKGNVHATVINSKTGAVVANTDLGQIGKATTPTTQKTFDQQFLDDANSATGMQTNSGYVGAFPILVAKYAPSMSLADIYKLYGSSNLGQKYGMPTEDASFVQQVYDQAKGGL